MDVAVFSWGNQPAGHGTLPSQGLLLRLHLGMASFGPLVGHDMSTMAFGWTLTFSTVVESV